MPALRTTAQVVCELEDGRTFIHSRYCPGFVVEAIFCKLRIERVVSYRPNNGGTIPLLYAPQGAAEH